MNTLIEIDLELLGAESELSPEIVDFICAVKKSQYGETDLSHQARDLDEYEQAMVA
jgi:hypothetical protein